MGEDHFSERQAAAFSEVEEKLQRYGIIQASSKSSDKLENQVKLINFSIKNSGQMSEQAFGRKMFMTLQQVFTLGMGSILLAVVQTNYPLDQFEERKNGEISDLEQEIKRANRGLLLVLKPEEAVFEKRASGEFEEEVERLLKERATEREVERVRARAAAERVLAAAGEGGAAVPAGAPPVIPEVPNEAPDHIPKSVLNALKKKIDSARDKAFVKASDDYAAYRRKSQEIENKKEGLEEEKKSIEKVTKVVEGLKGALVAIVTKVKDCVNSNEIVKGKLSMMAVLDATGEHIDDPLESNNLAGIYQHLTTHYKKASLIKFNNDFGATMKMTIPREEALKFPLKVVSETDKILFDWNNMGYWEFMTKDVFFTNILLCKLPVSKFKDDCTKHVSEEIRKRESEPFHDEKSVLSNGEAYMPLYLSLSEHIRSEQDSTEHLSFQTSNNQAQSSKPANHSYGQHKGGYKSVGGNVEMAAVALDEKNLAKGQYSTEVFRDRGITVRSVKTGVLHPYSATNIKCPDCYPSIGPVVKKHEPKCFEGLCKKCEKHGHTFADCHQK